MKKIVHLFVKGSVCVTGLRGTGKDLLMSNVAVRRNKPYISNVDYSGSGRSAYIPFVPEMLNLGGNDCFSLIDGQIKFFEWHYGDGTDIYLSDCGVYFPSQYNEKLNKKYPQIPVFFALSRHLCDNNVHINAQNLNRVWDKIREQSDTYIRCRWVIRPLVRLGIVIQGITIYDKYQSCVDRVVPFRLREPFILDKDNHLKWEIERDKHIQSYGNVNNRILIYLNKSRYNTRFFKEVFLNGSKEKT